MKLFLRSFIFHLCCIITFAIIYMNIPHDFHLPFQEKSNIDFVLLSTTIQSTVGLSSTYPLTFRSKLLVISQQLIMMMTHIITLYFFTI